jgi:hypothetical protein
MYCSNECIDKAHARQIKEYSLVKKANEMACLAYQTEKLRIEIMCSKEMLPVKRYIVDDDGNPLE